MKIKDMPYEHLELDEIRQELQGVLTDIKEAKCHNCVLRARERLLKMLLRYSSNASLCYIRYSCNTADEYYVKEHEYFDEIGPEVQALLTAITQALLESPTAPSWKRCWAAFTSATARWRLCPCPPSSWRI